MSALLDGEELMEPTGMQRVKPAPTSDFFGTPRWIVDLCERVAGPIDHDPFPDPEHQTWMPVDPVASGDGFRSWPVDLTILANPPFSNGGLPLAAERFADAARAVPDLSRFFVGIACPGAAYWREHLHPHMTAVAWLGRVRFIALRNMTLGTASKPRKVKVGEEVDGNRNEIALVYSGDRADTFARVFQLAGHPVSRPA